MILKGIVQRIEKYEWKLPAVLQSWMSSLLKDLTYDEINLIQI